MKNSIELPCPKCGSTTRVYLYTCEWRTHTVNGVSTRTGSIDSDELDYADDVAVRRVLPKVGLPADILTNNLYFLTHEPEGYLHEACHVWIHDPKAFVTDKDRVALDLQTRLMLTESEADNIVLNHYVDGDTVESIVERYSSVKTGETQIERIVNELRSLVPVDESRAKTLVDRFVKALDAHDLSAIGGGAVLRWAVTREPS